MASLLGFFTQQLVVFQDCLQKDPQANVGVWKTNNFNITGMSTGNGKADLYTPMVAAINVGIIQPVNDLTSVLSDSCVTGNCTFPGSDSGSFSTVGLGYTCTDITSQLVYAGNSTNSTVSLNMSSLSSNKPLVIGNKASPIVLSTGAISGSLDNSGSLVTVKMMYRKSFDQANVSAISCAIFPEVQTYHVNITKGKLMETLVDSVQIGRNALPVIRPYTFSYDLWTSHKRATSYVLRNGM